MIIHSVPELEAPEEQQLSDPVPLVVYTAEDLANIQRQLAEAREDIASR